MSPCWPAWSSIHKRNATLEDLNPSGNGEHILVVDDEETIASVQRMILENSGSRVTVYTVSSRALKAFKAEPDAFDAVITDLSMGELNGFQLAERICRIRPGTPIILCTGYGDLINEDRLGTTPIRGCLKKPVTVEQLLTAVESVMRKPETEGG